MNGGRDVTPERLAQLADGAAPRTEAERDAVALMADVRGLAEPAPDAVRQRVRAIASAEAPGATGWRRLLRGGDGRRRPALAAAPVAAAIVALAIAIPVATRDDGSAPPAAVDAPASARQGAGAEAGGAAAGAAPEFAAPRAAAAGPAGAAAGSTTADALRAAEPQADAAAGATAAELDRAVARARAALQRAGATGIDARESAGGTAATVVADVPSDQVDAATQALRSQGAQVTAGTEGDDGTAPIRATVTAGG